MEQPVFYNYNKEQLFQIGFSDEQCDKLIKKKKHDIVEKYLKTHTNDYKGALENLLIYLKKRAILANPYSLEKYLAEGLSLTEAQEKISALKFKTSGSLNRYIEKYGKKEGTERYNTFCKKSANTKETFQQKYGENWEIYWEEYKKSKDCRSDTFFKKKYGENWKEERDIFINAWAYKLSEEGLIEKHGENGSIIYKNIQTKKTNSLSNFIRKYGEENGIKKYELANKKRAHANTIEYYVEKYGVDKGIELYIKRSSTLGCTLENQISKYGLEEGTKRYNEFREKSKGRCTLDWYITKYGESVGKERFKEHYKNSASPQTISKSSILFFEKLSNFLDIDLLYGSRSNEKCLTRENGRNFYYDCVDEENQILFEYNGSYYHYHHSFPDSWMGYNGITPEESNKKDLEKKNLALKSGYKFCEIWDFEIKNKAKLMQKLEQIKEEFYENRTTQNLV